MELEPNAGVLGGARPYLCLGMRFQWDLDVVFAKTVLCFTPRRKSTILDVDNVVSPLLWYLESDKRCGVRSKLL
jgi:hypothetical protein